MQRKRPDRQRLGAALRRFREAQSLSQEALAAKAALHRTYVGSVERGERNPSFESIERWLAALNATWSDLGKALDEK